MSKRLNAVRVLAIPLLAALLFAVPTRHAWSADASCEAAGELERGTASWVMACDPPPPVTAAMPYLPVIDTSSLPQSAKVAIAKSCARPLAAANTPVPLCRDGDLRARMYCLREHPELDLANQAADPRVERGLQARCIINQSLDFRARLQCGYTYDSDRVAFTQQKEWTPRALEKCISDAETVILFNEVADIRKACAGVSPLDVCVDEASSHGPDFQAQAANAPKDDLRARIGENLKKARPVAVRPAAPRRTAGPSAPPSPCGPGRGYLPTPGGFGSTSCQDLGGSVPPPRVASNTGIDDLRSAPASGGVSFEPPAITFRVPASSAPAARAAAPRVQISRNFLKPAPRTTQSTITGREFGDSIRSYDNRQGTVLSGDGRKVSVSAVISSLQKVSPAAAQRPFVATSNGTLRFSPEAQRAFAQQGDQLRNVGGVELDVTFQNLATLGVPDMRTAGPATLIENPVILSMKALVAAAKPYAVSAERWRQLPETLRFPGNLARVYGYVLDPDSQDVFLIGTEATRPETRLDLDLMTVLMDVVWSKGLTPGVSLDPAPETARPASVSSRLPEVTDGRVTPVALSPAGADRPLDFKGPQYARIINLPSDTLASLILLDADYAMKQINLGIIRPAGVAFTSQMDIFKAADRIKDASTRFWFHPVQLNANTVRVSNGGRVVLFDSGVQLLAEDLTIAGAGKGEVNETALQTAQEFTRVYRDLETSPNVKPSGIFAMLHGVTDLVTLGKILREAGIDYPILDEFRTLPFRHLTGAEAVPTSYPGTTVTFQTRAGNVVSISGGVDLQSRSTRRSFDRFDDEVASVLAKGSSDLSPSSLSRRVSLTFTLPTQQSGQSAFTELAKQAGLRLLATNQPAAAAAKFRDVTNADPLDLDGWIFLARAQAAAGRFDEAQAALAQADAVDASDPAVRKARVQISLLANKPVDFAAIDAATGRDLSNEYVIRAFEGLRAAVATSNAGPPALADADLAVKLSPSNPQAYLIRGLLHDFGDMTDEAISDYTNLIRLDPTSSQALTLRGQDYEVQNRHDLALRDLTAALQIDPQNVRALKLRGDAFEESGDYDRALVEYNKALELSPQYAWAYFNRGLTEQKQSKLDIAIQDFTKAIAIDPDHRFALAYRGFALAEQRDFDAALRDFDAAIRLNGRFGLAFLGRAETLFAKGAAPDEIIAACDQVIALEPQIVQPYRFRGLAYFKKNDFDRAIADFDRALQLSPTTPEMFSARGDAYRQKKAFDRAIQDYDQALRLDQSYEKALNNRGTAYLGKADRDHAMQDFSRSIELKPDDALAYSNRGSIFTDTGKLDLALADLNKAIELDPKLAPAFNNRGRIYSLKGDLKRGIEDYTQALRLQPDDALAYYNRANAYSGLGDVDHALADNNDAIRLQPAMAPAYLNRGNLYAFRKQTDTAIGDYDRAIQLDPTMALAFSARGQAYEDKNDGAHALADYNESIRLDPTRARTYYYRGLMLRDANRGDQAIADFDAAIKRDPTYAPAYFERGLTYAIAKNDTERSFADYSESLKRDPTYTPAYLTRGNALMAKGDLAGAIVDLSMAVQLNPRAVLGFERRANAYLKTKDYGHAIADATEAIRLDPNRVQPYVTRGTARADLNDMPNAIADLSQAIQMKPSSDTFFSRAIAYGMLKDYDHAIADYTSALQISPNSYGFYKRGEAYDNSGRKASAMTDYSEAIRLDPKLAPALYKRGTAFYLAHDLDRALADFNALLQAEPTVGEVYIWRGTVWADRKDFDRAIADFSEAIRLNPRNAVAFAKRGVAYDNKGDVVHSRADFAEAARLDPRLR